MSHHSVPGKGIFSKVTRVVSRCAPVKIAVPVLAAAMAVSALAGCGGYVDVGALQHLTNSYSVSGPVQTLAVNAHVGDVSIIGGDSGKVSVTEHISYRHTVPVTTHRTAAGTITLDSNCPALETCSVSYDIKVPRTMTVRVTDNVGVIRLESLSGQVTAHTNVGDIDLGSVSGPIEVTGHAGSIRGQDVSSPHATLRSSTGDIEVAFSAAPETITATTDIGSVTLRVPGNQSYSLNASTLGSTRVSVTLSPRSPHAITASTWAGSITIEPAP
jgi:hypothetical protein